MSKDTKNIKNFVEKYSIKNVAVIENETVESGTDMHSMVKALQYIGIPVTVINGAYYNKKKLLDAITAADTILFESQFRYWEQVASVAKLFAMFPKKQIFGHAFLDNMNLEGGLNECLSTQELATMAHHDLYEVASKWSSLYYDIKEDTAIIEKINLQKYVRRLKAEELLKERHIINKVRNDEKEKIWKIRTTKRTGRKVKILDIYAQGSEWSKLKIGSIVDELDCMHFDPNPHTGVWVMGNTEPVKLVNSNEYLEWEYHAADSFAIALELLSIIGQKANPTWITTMPMWVNKFAFRKEEYPGEHHVMITDLLDSFNVERRFFRHHIEGKIRQWADDHKFFIDDVVSVARKSQEMVMRIAELGVEKAKLSRRVTMAKIQHTVPEEEEA